MRTIVTSYSEQQQRNLVEVQGGYLTDNEGSESSVSIPNKAKEMMMHMHMQHQHQHQPQTQEVTTAFETAETKAAPAVVSPAISPISHAKSYIEQDQEEPRNNDDDDDNLHRRNCSKINNTNNVNNLIDSDSNNDNNYISDSSNTTINGEDSSNSQSLSQSISQSLSQFALSITQSQQRQQPQPQSPPLLLQDSSVAINLKDLYLLLKRREWDKVFDLLEKNPNLVASSQQSQQTTVTSTTKASGTSTSPLLHDVLRYNPPLSVVDLLLVIDNNTINDEDDNNRNSNNNNSNSNSNDDTIQKQQQSSVMKQTDAFGRLPLHVACSCGPNADIDVIIKLILSDTDALRTRTLDRHGQFPLHIAVIMNASEDVVMELLTNYPDACFSPDLHGKIPIEYAKESSYRNGHNRLVVALESAPILLASSQAGINRISKGYEDRLSCLRDAHTEYANQLEDRYTNEKFELLTNQLKSNDELAIEKERNIALAEVLLEKKKSELILIRERDELQSKLDMERSLRRNVTKMRDEELKRILLGKEKEKNNDEDDNDQEKYDDDDKNDGQEETTIADEINVGGDNNENDDDDDNDDDDEEDSSKLPLSTLLKSLAKGYEESKLRIRSYKEQLNRQRETVTNMNHLLANKDEELRQVNRKFRSSSDDNSERQAAIDRADNLAGLHEIALQNLSEARDEVDRLKRIDVQRRSKIAHSERRLRIQEKRLSSVQDLMSSLSTNVGSWKATGDNNGNNVADDREVEVVVENNSTNSNNNDNNYNHYLGKDNNMHDGAGSAITSPSMRQDEADLSVEIEMAATLAAMTAAHLDCAATTITSPSMRLNEMDLSVEIRLAAAAMTNNTATYQHDGHDDGEKEDTINEEEHTSTSNGSILTPNTTKQPTVKNRRIKSAAAAMTNTTATYQHVEHFEHDDDEKEDTIIEEDHTSSSNGTILTPNTTKQPTIKNRSIKSLKGRPRTYSILTATAATTDCDSGSGESGDLTSVSETPPIPERVEGSTNREEDGCSPLGLPTLAFQHSWHN
jgi:hypothetical protein